jgi:hypothetical protein
MLGGFNTGKEEVKEESPKPVAKKAQITSKPAPRRPPPETDEIDYAEELSSLPDEDSDEVIEVNRASAKKSADLEHEINYDDKVDPHEIKRPSAPTHD